MNHGSRAGARCVPLAVTGHWAQSSAQGMGTTQEGSLSGRCRVTGWLRQWETGAGERVAIWPPSGTLGLGGPSLSREEGAGAGAPPSPHRSCRTKAFSTREGTDSALRAAAE